LPLLGAVYHDADQNFLDQPPGEQYSYSNPGYGLLGYPVESISSQSLAEYTRIRVSALECCSVPKRGSASSSAGTRLFQEARKLPGTTVHR
jgi:hypothetical protein